MTWIKTIKMEDDEQVRKAMMEQRKLYPMEYATPVPIVDHGIENSIVGSHSLFPKCCFMPSARLGADVARAPFAAR